MIQLTHGSLFAGIGGMDWGFERAGMVTLWQVEIDEYARRVLAKHWPRVKRYGDIRECGKSNLAPVDVISGGFPCQDVSAAGKRIGITGERSSLWREMYRVLCELRPRFAVIENTTGLFDRGFSDVLCDLAEGGFDAEWRVLSACQFGRPHTRERVFIVAYPNSATTRREHRRIGRAENGGQERNLHIETTEPPCLRMAPRVPHRMDRLRGCGNSVVPAVAEFIGRRLVESIGGK